MDLIKIIILLIITLLLIIIGKFTKSRFITILSLIPFSLILLNFLSFLYQRLINY